MKENPTMLAVVAAIVRDRDGRMLLQQAQPGKAHAGQWEFPGGKVEPGETPRAALVREVTEELGISLDPAASEPAAFADQPAGEGQRTIVLFLYNCPVWSGKPQGREGQQWGWFSEAEAEAAALAPLDRALLRQLRR